MIIQMVSLADPLGCTLFSRWNAKRKSDETVNNSKLKLWTMRYCSFHGIKCKSKAWGYKKTFCMQIPVLVWTSVSVGVFLNLNRSLFCTFHLGSLMTFTLFGDPAWDIGLAGEGVNWGKPFSARSWQVATITTTMFERWDALQRVIV